MSITKTGLCHLPRFLMDVYNDNFHLQFFPSINSGNTELPCEVVLTIQ